MGGFRMSHIFPDVFQISTKYLAGLFLSKPIDIHSYGNDHYGHTLGVVHVDGKNVNQ